MFASVFFLPKHVVSKTTIQAFALEQVRETGAAEVSFVKQLVSVFVAAF